MKFDNVLGEAAWTLAGHGFNDGEYGDLSEGDPHWNGLVQVSSVLLNNIGEHALARDLTGVNGGAHCVVWLRVLESGVTWCQQAALIAHGQQVIDAFEVAEHAYLDSKVNA